MGIVFFSLGMGVFFIIFGIVSIIEMFRVQERCEYLEKQIEQQSMLIEYLKGE
jgi:hypothetical protein